MRKVALSTTFGLMIVAFLVGALVFAGVPALAGETGETDDDNRELYDLLEKVVNIISRDALISVEREDLIYSAIEGIIDSLDDPYAAFIPEEDYQVMMDRYRNEGYAGIGVRVTQAPEGARILDVFPDGPAAQADLKADDIIIEVDGVSLADMAIDEIVNHIRGPKGTALDIKILRDNEELGPIQLRRDQIMRPTLTYQEVQIDGEVMGLISIREFAETTPDELEQALDNLSESSALLIDLRGNRGGLLQSAVNASGHLVPSGDLLEVHGRDEILVEFESDSPGLEIPLTVLVDGGTASGAEIMAGIARERADALIVGTETFGKGQVQSVYGVNGAGLRITSAEYVLPSGTRISEDGLIPDVFIFRTGSVRPGPEYLPVATGLGYGDEGDEVQALQLRLKLAGYLDRTPDGEFDVYTQRALMLFQANQGLQPTGVVDGGTRDRLMAVVKRPDSFLDYPELDADSIRQAHPYLPLDRQSLEAWRLLLGILDQ